MTKWARIENNVARDVVSVHPSEAFHPDLVDLFVEVPEEVVEYSTYDEETETWSEPTNIPEPTSPPLIPRALTNLEFLRHAQSVGGLTDENLIAAYDNAMLKVFWLKFNIAKEIRKDDSDIAAGLAAWQALGYLTEEGAAAIVDQWPSDVGFV